MYYGIDISSAQHPNNSAISWAQVAHDLSARGEGGQPFVIIKLTEADSYLNPFAIPNPNNPLPLSDLEAAKANNFTVAFYHFMHAGVSGESQLAFIKQHLPEGYGIFLDLEDLGLDGRPQQELFAQALSIFDDPAVLGVYMNNSWRVNAPEHLFTKHFWFADPSNVAASTSRDITQVATRSVSGVVTTVDINTASSLEWAQPYITNTPLPTPVAEPAPASVEATPINPQPTLSWIQEAINQMPTIEENSTDALHVKMAQGLLNANGSNLAIDGGFGPLTLREVLAFQHQNGLAIDGIVGPQTWTRLLGA